MTQLNHQRRRLKMRNDPSLNEIHAIRYKIYEEIKNMTDSEAATYFNQRAESIAKECGFKFVYLSDREAKLVPINAEVIENAKI
jgi:ribonucleotide reductase beta subunit family protein with ferritin-like domain